MDAAQRARAILTGLYLFGFVVLTVLVVQVMFDVRHGSVYGPEILAAIDSVKVAAMQSRQAAEAARDAGTRVDSASARIEKAVRDHSITNRWFIMRWNRVLSEQVHQTHVAVDSVKQALPALKRR